MSRTNKLIKASRPELIANHVGNVPNNAAIGNTNGPGGRVATVSTRLLTVPTLDNGEMMEVSDIESRSRLV